MLNLALDVWSERTGGEFAPGIPAPALNLDLTNPATASLLTTTRASVGYADDSSGNWSSFANNIPRITDKGLLVEEARTNSLRNNSMQGAVPGTPGTLPTDWTSSSPGLTQTIVGVGTEKGIDYIDIRFAGISSSPSILIALIPAANCPAAVVSQVWAQSVFLSRIDGSFANVTSFEFQLLELDAGRVQVGPTLITPFNAPASTLERRSASATLVQATVAFLRPRIQINIANGAAIDFTLRIGWPQLELGAFPTSPIRTTSAAVLRAADNIQIASPGSWFVEGPGTMFADGSAHSTLVGTPAVFQIDAGSNADRYIAQIDGVGDSAIGTIITGGVTQASIVAGVSTANTKMAMAFATNDVAVSANGAAVVVDATTVLPVSLSRAFLGTNASGGFWSGYIRRVAYWASRLTNAQLRVITGGSLIPPPVLDLILTNPGNDAALTTVRASNAWADNEAGEWSMFAPNVARLTDKGLLVEEARTNSIRNNSMQGAVAGTPGTLPTNWLFGNLSGLTQTIVGIGTEKGIDYIDIRLSGTSSGTIANLFNEASGVIAASNGQAWTLSTFIAMVGGSKANITQMYSYVRQQDAASATLTDLIPLTNFLPDVSSTLTRLSGTVTTNNASIAFVRPGILSLVFANGAAIDITLRIGWPQLELGAFPTSPIKTATVAVQRNGDVVTVPSFVPNQPEGTIFADVLPNVVSGEQALVSIDVAGSTTERHTIRSNVTVNGITVDENVAQSSINIGTLVAGNPAKAVYAYKLNDMAGCMNGGAVVTDLGGNMPTTTGLYLGARALAGGTFLHGWLRRVAYWNVRMPDAFLRAFTA